MVRDKVQKFRMIMKAYIRHKIKINMITSWLNLKLWLEGREN
jgi:hypothetical protein